MFQAELGYQFTKIVIRASIEVSHYDYIWAVNFISVEILLRQFMYSS